MNKTSNHSMNPDPGLLMTLPRKAAEHGAALDCIEPGTVARPPLHLLKSQIL
jgi:hypothetical protein